MEIIFNTEEMDHIKDMSFYNNNYYKLPYIIDGCDILYQKWEDDDYYGLYILGTMNENRFEKKFELFGDMDGNVDSINN